MTTSMAGGAGGDHLQSLMIDVRANTQGFAQDLSTMRGSFDNTLIAGFSQAGSLLDSGITQALARGANGFTALKATAMAAMGDIAASASGNLFGAMGADSGLSAVTGLAGLSTLSGLMGAFMGLPGRATGGPVSPGQPYLVGERGPELFVPTSAGSVATGAATGGGGREVRVSISVNAPAESSAPQSLQRSSRQVASAVRRALTQF